MVDDKEHSTLFGALIGSLLSEGLGFRFRARGRSMQPTIQDGEILHIRPVSAETLRKRDIVLFAEGKHFRAHRLVVVDLERSVFRTRGDAGGPTDAPLCLEQILGRVVAKEDNSGCKPHVVQLCGTRARTAFLTMQSRNAVSRMIRRSSFLMGARLLIQKRILGAVGLLSLLTLFSGQSVGQIVADTATTGTMTAAVGTTTLTFRPYDRGYEQVASGWRFPECDEQPYHDCHWRDL